MKRFSNELEKMGLAHGRLPREVVTESDLERVPPTARRYLRFMGVVLSRLGCRSGEAPLSDIISTADSVLGEGSA